MGARFEHSNVGRIVWIDICKFIAIVIVVTLHYGAPTYIDEYFHLFHMPIFFFLSGYCLGFKHYLTIVDFVKTRLKTLIVPYFLFSIIIYIFWNFLFFYLNNEKMVSLNEYLRCLFWNNTTPYSNHMGAVQWFVTALFFTEFVYVLLRKIFVDNYKLIICVILITIIGFVFSMYSSNRLPLGIDCMLIVLVFYLIGDLIKEKNCIKLLQCWDTRKQVISILLMIVALAIIYIINGEVNIRQLHLGNPFLYIMGAIIGIFLLVFVSFIFEKLLKEGVVKRAIIFWGQNTLIILYAHLSLGGIFEGVLSVLSIELSSVFLKYIFYILKFLFCFVLVVPISMFIRRYCKVLIGKW